MSFRLGIDLGGTSAKLALVGPHNKIIKEGSVSTQGRSVPKEIIEKLTVEAHRLMKGKKISQVGVGVAGDIDFEKGVIRVSPNLGWKRVPFGRLLAQRLRRKVILDNDANVAAWGIYKTQVSPKVKHMMVLTLGTGVGGGIILNGRVHRGATGTAGEVGHLTMIEGGRQCNCGNKGCLETYSGGLYLTREVRRQLEKGQQSQLRSLFNDNPDQLNPFVIAEAAQAGDPYAQSVWNEVGHYLGVAIGNLIYVFNPEVIFLTGGVSHARDLILKPLWKTLRERAFKVPVGAVKIKIAKNAGHMGVIGASLL